MSHVYSKAVSSVVEDDNVAIHWIFELTDKSGKVHRIDEMSLQEWRGDKIFRERFFMIRRGRKADRRQVDTSAAVEASRLPIWYFVIVMPGLVPGIHVYTLPSDSEDVDGRDIWREDALRASARP